MLPWIVGGALLAVLFALRRRLARALLLPLIHTVYRIRVTGTRNIPSGGALLVANHLSFVDALLVGASAPRPVQFLMHRSFFRAPIVGRFAAMMGAMPVASEDSANAKAEALAAAARAAAGGALVCIFAEGAISRSGALLPFARGLERIARDAKVPIVPVGLDRVFGSIFSFAGGQFFWKWPRRLPYPVDVAFGSPLPCETESWRVRDAVQALIAATRESRAPHSRSLAYRFVRNARQSAPRTAVVDSTGRRMTYRELLTSALVLRSILRRRIPADLPVGILLPPSAAGALANVALALSGQPTVNLNYTMSNRELEHPIAKSRLKHVITSRKFLAALGRESPVPATDTLFMEDFAELATAWDKLSAFALSYGPGLLLARWLDPIGSGDETATIIFSSGSTGTPKGVVLSHANIGSNVQGVAQIFGFEEDDSVLGVLPFFHSFGYTGTLWTPLLSGGVAIYHHDPLDAKTIGELAARERATILMGAPTFYQAWLRRIEAEALASLRLTVCGGEKLTRSLADRWREKFGQDLIEGYGCTELSPVVAINVPDVSSDDARQAGLKPGTVGRALPGIALRIVDAESGELLPPETEGLLLVRGPNVMRGYLDEPQRTAEALRDGWYVTGDMAMLDRDAFLVITDRLARFSKVGGEMVPHGRVEAELLAVAERLLGASASGATVEFGVTSLADEQKGERLVVVHTPLSFTVEDWAAGLRESSLPKLFLPRTSNFVEIESLPRLGSGKTDLRALREHARKRLGQT
jgi:acyl-[acyl-carrier-protein]-phospholipid O-acyltransferase/long-chain-fatty-acid--[acyl-carrier-protein] ligase